MNDKFFTVSLERAIRYGSGLDYLQGALDDWLMTAEEAHRSVLSIANMEVLMTVERIPTIQNSMIALAQIESSLEALAEHYSLKPELLARIDLTYITVRDLKVRTFSQGAALLRIADLPFSQRD